MPNETAMEAAVATWIKMQRARILTIHQLPVRGGRIDIVAYEKNQRLFKIYECKATKQPSNIEQAFRQVGRYGECISADTDKFLRDLSRKMVMNLRRWKEATHSWDSIRIKFYVVFPAEACEEKRHLLSSLRLKFPKIGILKFKSNGNCKTVQEASPETLTLKR